MKINSLQLEGFMSIDRASIELPDIGIVLVTGMNGSGKSSLIEAVSACYWGKTLRGTPWWRAEGESVVEVESPSASVRRLRKGTKNKVTILGSDATHDTASKATEHLLESLPSQEVWRKTCVFTSAAIEGVQFTSGGDGERKRLLEAVLGIEKFDVALEKCRGELKRQEAILVREKHAHEMATTKLDYERQREAEAIERREDFEMPDRPPDVEAKKLGAELSKLLPQLEALVKKHRSLEVKKHRLSTDVRSAKLEEDRLAHDKCPTCAQPIAATMREALALKVVEVTEAFATATVEIDREMAQLQEEISELEETVKHIDTRRRDLVRASEGYSKLVAEKARLDKSIADAVLAATSCYTAQLNAAGAIKKAGTERDLLAAVEDVLGLRGVRASVLAHTLLGLEGVANKWLAKMKTELRVRLRPYTEKKTGGVSDAIGIVIEGAGAGHGYDACSQGQRRRIDVAIVLALATLAQVAGAGSGGTLFFDEVFDALDEDGALGVTAALEELAQDRCVVVISHAGAVQRALATKLHLHVEDGRVIEVAA